MRKPFIKQPTKTTPGAGVSYKSGKVVLKGRSSPENTLEFYNPYFAAIAQLAKEQCIEITANFQLIYFNTSSARCIYLTLKELQKLESNGKKVVVNWYAEIDDEDMVETGIDFQDMFGMNFNIVKYRSKTAVAA